MKDWKGNDIKEGQEICLITIKTGGYFGEVTLCTPINKKSVTIPAPIEEDCWQIGEYAKVINYNGQLCINVKSGNSTGIVPLEWIMFGDKQILAIKGVSDTK